MITTQQEAAWQQAVREQILFDHIDEVLEPTHDARPVTQVGPGGSNSCAVCDTCGWWGPGRSTRTEAESDANQHNAEVR